jgi:hypothetical protein
MPEKTKISTRPEKGCAHKYDSHLYEGSHVHRYTSYLYDLQSNWAYVGTNRKPGTKLRVQK